MLNHRFLSTRGYKQNNEKKNIIDKIYYRLWETFPQNCVKCSNKTIRLNCFSNYPALRGVLYELSQKEFPH